GGVRRLRDHRPRAPHGTAQRTALAASGPPGARARLLALDEARLTAMSADANPTVVEVLRFENLPPGSLASRRAVVRWSDGSEGEALRWYSDEVKFSEGDLLGKSREQLRSLHFRRDRDWLQS